MLEIVVDCQVKGDVIKVSPLYHHPLAFKMCFHDWQFAK